MASGSRAAEHGRKIYIRGVRAQASTFRARQRSLTSFRNMRPKSSFVFGTPQPVWECRVVPAGHQLPQVMEQQYGDILRRDGLRHVALPSNRPGTPVYTL